MSGDDVMTPAEVSVLVGDDIDYWLGNPFMAPELLAEKVAWWVTRALAARLEPIEVVAEQWEADDREHLATFGQHLMGGAVASCAEQLRAALTTEATTGAGHA